jgi:hypothetical protein
MIDEVSINVLLSAVIFSRAERKALLNLDVCMHITLSVYKSIYPTMGCV